MNWQIQKPTLILRPSVARANIRRMAGKARRSGVRFRPHFKTHQSAGVGEWFREEGVAAITVSSVDMARYFADHGWEDITIAFPVNWLEIDKINELAARVKLNLLLESAETARFLGQNLHHPVAIWLKIDTGYGRTGLAWHDEELLRLVAGNVDTAGLTLCGLLTHAGHAYRPGRRSEKETIYQQTVQRLQEARDILAWPALALSLGDTPTCSLVEDFSGVDEIRPGNFVFYDYTMVHLGACDPEDIALALACPVVALHPERGEVIVYGGAIHLSKESLPGPDGQPHYGRAALPAEDGWGPILADAFVIGLSQEHGRIQVTPGQMEQIQVGDVLMVLPVHSCLTANLRQGYLTTDGDWIEMAGIL